MTYALAWALQQGLYTRLLGDAGVAAHVADRIYDAAPPETGAATELYLTLGDDKAKDWSTGTAPGAEHEVRIAVTAPRAGFAEAKEAAAAVCDALLGADIPLSRGHLICLAFQGAETQRLEDDALRRILLSFRALVEDTA